MFATSRRTLFLVSIVYFFSYPEVDPDLWGHLFFGRQILQGGGLPERNLYSYTAPDYPWINHEWLSEVIFFSIFAVLGSPGLIVLKVFIGSGIVWLLHGVIRERGVPPLPRALSLVWTMAIVSPGFNLRPQIFTYLFFAVFLSLLHRFKEGGKGNVYIFPALTTLWVNLHGGFVAGLGALGLFSLWSLFSDGFPAGKAGRTLARVLPLALSAFALALNPYGLELIRFLAKDLFIARPITEWQPIPLTTVSFVEFKLAVLLVLIVGLNTSSWRRWDFALTLIAAFLATRHQRHIPLFGIAAAPYLAVGLGTICKTVEERTRPWLLSIALVAVVLYLSLAIGRIHFHHRLQLVVDPGQYPVQAGDFLQHNGVQGNLAVPFDWGEYLIWKLQPAIRVSVDGRYTTAYPPEVLQDNWEWMQGGERWRQLLDRYPTDIAITHRLHPVTKLLWKDPRWVYIYSDPVAFIFVRETVSQEKLLTRFKEGALLPPRPPSHHFPG
jgi:hypothetical protein